MSAYEYTKQWKKENQDKVAEQQRRYRKKYKKEIYEKKKKWAEENPNKVKEQQRRYREKHREEINERARKRSYNKYVEELAVYIEKNNF